VTGCFYAGDVDGLVDAVRGFDDGAVDPAVCVRNAQRFDLEAFRRVLPRHVDRAIAAAGEHGRDGAEHLRRSARGSRRQGLARRPT
jgi:hypothetical protein